MQGSRKSSVHGIGKKTVLPELAYSFAMEIGKADKKWLQNILQRHVTLSLEKLPATSASQMKRFTPMHFAAFLDIFEMKVEKMKFSPNHMLSIKTDMRVVQYKSS